MADFYVLLKLRLQNADEDKVEEYMTEVLSDSRENHLFPREAIELKEVKRIKSLTFLPNSFGTIGEE